MSHPDDDPDVAQGRKFLEILTAQAARLETDMTLAGSPQQRAAWHGEWRQLHRFIDALHRLFPDLAGEQVDYHADWRIHRIVMLRPALNLPNCIANSRTDSESPCQTTYLPHCVREIERLWPHATHIARRMDPGRPCNRPPADGRELKLG
ncbi:hypothetical protein [Nocardia sp. NPDC003183]